MKTHIKNLLNRKIDHRTQSHHTQKVIFLSVLFIMIATAAPIWPTLPEANATTNAKALIFRNIPSWSRAPEDEFEGVLEKLSIPFDVKCSREMADADLSQYSFIVLPGAQWNTGYYADFEKYYERFEEYVKNGGTLVVEMNGAEEEGMKLPGGAYMVNHPAFDNITIAREHPLVAPQKKTENYNPLGQSRLFGERTHRGNDYRIGND